jgi:hypothetical protein
MLIADVTPNHDRVPTAEEAGRLAGRQSPAEYVCDRYIESGCMSGGVADWTEAREMGFWPPPVREQSARATRSRRTR